MTHGSTSWSSTPTTTCTRRKDAFTRHLPERYKGAIDYVEVRGRTKIVVRGHDQRLHPEPDLRRRGPPRRPGGVLPHRQPRGQVVPRDHRRADAVPPGLPRARRPHRADGRARRRPDAHVPDARQPARGADARRPRADPRRHPLAQRVAARDVDVQLRGPHLHDAGHHAADRREGDRGARVGASSAAPRPSSSGRRRCRATAAPGRSASRSSTRSGRRSSTPTSSSRCTRPTAATRATRPTGRARRRCCRSGSTRSGCCTMGKRPIEDTMAALTCHGVLTRFPDLRIASVENGGDWVIPLPRAPRRRPPQDAADLRRGPGRGVQAQRLRQPVPRGRHRRSSSRRSASTTSCSGPTTRTPRAWPSRAATSTTCPPGLPEDGRGQDHGRQPRRDHAGPGPGHGLTSPARRAHR